MKDEMKILSEKIMSTEQVESETDYVVCEVDRCENKRYYNSEGQYHRENGPAEEYYGDKDWYLNGKLHRENGPAVECLNGDKSWYLNGKCHREDGPAVEWSDGSKEWYLNDKMVNEEIVRKLGKIK